MNESWHTFEWVMAHMCNVICSNLLMAHSWMSHVTHLNESWHTCAMWHVVASAARVDRIWCCSFIRVPWLIHMCAMTHSYVCHDSSYLLDGICVQRITSSHGVAMRWLRLVGSLKSLVCFAEYHLFDRALLQKRPIILRSLLLEASP